IDVPGLEQPEQEPTAHLHGQCHGRDVEMRPGMREHDAQHDRDGQKIERSDAEQPADVELDPARSSLCLHHPTPKQAAGYHEEDGYADLADHGLEPGGRVRPEVLLMET